MLLSWRKVSGSLELDNGRFIQQHCGSLWIFCACKVCYRFMVLLVFIFRHGRVLNLRGVPLITTMPDLVNWQQAKSANKGSSNIGPRVLDQDHTYIGQDCRNSQHHN